MVSGVKRAGLVAVVLLLGAFNLRAQTNSAASTSNPPAPATPFPEPPAQREAWTPPKNSLPPATTAAFTKLFDEGMADPRGCDYCEIEVVVGSCWGGDGYPVKTHGWVLPGQDSPRFAVCWSGLVYPVVSVGAPANLQQDVNAMLKKDQAVLDKSRARYAQTEKQRRLQVEAVGQKYTPVDWPLRWQMGVCPEVRNVAWETMRPLKAAMLFRLGKADLATKIWTQWYGGLGQNEKEPDPYCSLAKDWAWAIYDRAVCAHMRGDSQLALHDTRAIGPIASKIDTEATAHKTNVHRSYNDNAPHSFIDFAEHVPDLLADEERRAQEAPYVPVLLQANPPQGAERIKQLVRDMELVSARQDGQPGGVDLAQDPIVRALIASGDDAVEPLLDCLENDTRLTRSVHFWRDFATERTILSVNEAAYAALANILQTSFFGAGSTGDNLTAHGAEGRKSVAASFRAYWLKYKGTSLQDRWYAILSDDKTAASQWLQAAGDIVQDADITNERSSMFGAWQIMPNRKPGEVVPMSGEALRAKTNPSVTDLLLKRMNDLSAPMNQFPDTNLEQRIELALMLAKWDGKPHLKELRDLTAFLIARIDSKSPDNQRIVSPLMRVFAARVRLGDEQALGEYAQWLPSVRTLGREIGFGNDVFEIMWKNPTDPAIAAAAEKIFAANSEWMPLLGKDSFFTERIFTTSMVGLPAFRAELQRGLADKTQVGSGSLDATGNTSIALKGGMGGTNGDQAVHDLLTPPAGTSFQVRLCDLYAHELSRLEGTPNFHLYWPEKKRDEAIPLISQFLDRYGDAYTFRELLPGINDFLNQAHFHLPALDHPATEDDVQHGRAIFALGAGVRAWPMPSFPMQNAVWTTLKEWPQDSFGFADGKQTKVITYDNRGTVWQAEEVQVDGKWQRFFGFVGAHHVTKVPAAQIEFSSPWPWFSLTSGFDCSVTSPAAMVPRGRDVEIPPLTAASPLPVTIKVRNRAGIEQAVPGSLLVPAGASKTLPHALTLKLEYTEKTTMNAEEIIPPADWRTIPQRAEISTAAPQAAGLILPPTREFTTLTLNLHDYFDITKPGHYRLKTIFHDPTGEIGDFEALQFQVR